MEHVQIQQRCLSLLQQAGFLPQEDPHRQQSQGYQPQAGQNGRLEA